MTFQSLKRQPTILGLVFCLGVTRGENSNFASGS